MKDVKIETKAKFIICLLGFTMGIFMSKYFVRIIKDNVENINPVMYLFYCAATIGVKINFVPFVIFPILFWS
ncbi:hypothetical protein [Staphylococcus hyicus]|uniref:hypothetical protein n=1 Tax=Staphylococcus hyicus TaxID=1284 RepID=UPI003132EF47